METIRVREKGKKEGNVQIVKILVQEWHLVNKLFTIVTNQMVLTI